MCAAASQSSSGTLCVLGIDPGLSDVGYGVIEFESRTGKSKLLDFGVLRTPAGMPIAERLLLIHRDIETVVRAHQPAVVAVEQLFFAKNSKTAMVVAHGRAACILAAAPGRELVEYTPLQIKKALTGSGGAGKLQVQMMVRVLLGLKEIPKPDHAADALGAALCHVHSLALKSKIAAAVSIDTRRANGRSALKELLAQVRPGKRRRR